MKFCYNFKKIGKKEILMKKIKILVFLIFFCQFSVLANNLPQNIKKNLGINQFLDESLKEILNQPLKEKFALTPKGNIFSRVI